MSVGRGVRGRSLTTQEGKGTEEKEIHPKEGQTRGRVDGVNRYR